MTRRSAGQAQARRPLDWSGRGGSERSGPAPLRSCEEEAPRSAWLGRAARDTYRYGPRRGGAGRRAGPGAAGRAWTCGRPLRLRFRPGGPGPPGRSAALGARGPRRPALRPSKLLGGSLGCPSPRRPRAPRPHRDSRVRGPAGTRVICSGVLSLPGLRRPCSGEFEPPPDPHAFPGRGSLVPCDRGGVRPRLHAGAQGMSSLALCPRTWLQSGLQRVL